MDKYVYVLSDTEFGAGNLTDDFVSDRLFSEFIHALAGRADEMDLVFNGDTFDLIRCPVNPGAEREEFPVLVTAGVAAQKLRHISRAHPAVFEALNAFCAKPQHRIFFVIGNHDPDLVFPEAQDAIRGMIGTIHDNVFFPGLHYDRHGIHAEHGHQYDKHYRVDPNNLTLDHQVGRVVNLPFLTGAIMKHFIHIKQLFPALDRVVPRIAPFHLPLSKQLMRSSFKAIAHSYLWDGIVTSSPPFFTWKAKRACVADFLSRWNRARKGGKDMWNVDNVVALFEANIEEVGAQTARYNIFGHTHATAEHDLAGGKLIEDGCWRDEYLYDPKTNLLNPKKKTFVEFLVRDGEARQYRVSGFRSNHTPMSLEEVSRDELGFLARAAEEEKISHFEYEKPAVLARG